MSSEARALFYSENTMAFEISAYKSEREMALFSCRYINYDHIAESKIDGVPVEKTERFLVKVEIQCHEQFPIVFSSVKHTVDVLLENPRLRQLEIILEDDHCGVQKPVLRVLEPFARLRNVEKVIFKNVPPVYARYLRTKMTEGPSKLKSLLKKYHVTDKRVHELRYVDNQMETLLHEMERGHKTKYEYLEGKVIWAVDRDAGRQLEECEESEEDEEQPRGCNNFQYCMDWVAELDSDEWPEEDRKDVGMNEGDAVTEDSSVESHEKENGAEKVELREEKMELREDQAETFVNQSLPSPIHPL